MESLACNGLVQSWPEIVRLAACGRADIMWPRTSCDDVFAHILGRTERSLVQELRDWRNKWAHQEPFSSDDADRALDSMTRLLTAISAPQADDVNRMKQELRRLIYEEQVRGEKREAEGFLIEAVKTGALKPWRDIVTPTPTSPAVVISRPNSLRTCGRCI